MTRHALATVGLAVSCLAGCVVGPNYERPTMATPAAYKENRDWKQAAPQDQVERGPWWAAFGDPALAALLHDVPLNNQTLRAAEARFRQARSLAQQARAGWFPTVTASAGATRSYSGAGGGVRSASGLTTFSSSGSTATAYDMSLGASWEPDLWGRIRRGVEAGEATAQSSAADLESARLSALAETAANYFQIRVLDAQKRLLDDTIQAYQRSLQLTRNQYAVGVAKRADVVLAETQLQSAQAQAIDTGAQRAQLEHAVAVLLGKAPADFSLPVTTALPPLPVLPVGLPSELLERRPDVASAERLMAAANARIGVAQSAFYPSLTLSAGAGFQSSALSTLLNAPSRFWSLGPALATTLFDAGLRRAQTDQAIAAYDETVANYRQAVLTGFQEVEDNLATLRILEQEAKVQGEAVKSSRQSVALALNQYRAGTVSYLDVVTVQTTLLGNERTLVAIEGRRYGAAVNLIKALGGGWQAENLKAVQTN